MNMIETLQKYLAFPFVQNALLVGVLISLCASLLGIVLVLKRFSFIGDSLSHVSFSAMILATIFGITDNMWFVLILTIACAVFLLKSDTNRKVNGDSLLALISVGSLAVGYLLVNMFSKSSNIAGDVCSTLFGATSILTLTNIEVILSIVLSIIVCALFVVSYNKIFSVTFDEKFSKATGINVSVYNLCMSIIIAVIIVLAMKLVGSLLISALVIFPALSAMQLCKNFKAVTVVSIILSVITSVLGILVSILMGTPVGSTIVAVEIIIFIIFGIIGKCVKEGV